MRVRVDIWKLGSVRKNFSESTVKQHGWQNFEGKIQELSNVPENMESLEFLSAKKERWKR